MRTRLVTTLLLAGLASTQAGIFVLDSGSEFSAAGDFDGDGHEDIVLLDKQTGSYRLGLGSDSGAFDFSTPALASGMAPVTGVAAGKLDSTVRDSFAACSPHANRVHFLSPTSAPYVPPVVTFSTGAGPATLAAVDIPGASNTAHADLQIGSLYSPMSETRLNAGAGQGTVLYGGSVLGGAPSGMNPLALESGGTDFTGYFVEGAAGTLEFTLDEPTETGPVNHAVLGGLPAGSQFAASIFDQPTSLLIFYTPGSPLVRTSQSTKTAPGNFVLEPLQASEFGAPVRLIAPLPGTAPPKLLVVYADGGSADIVTHSLAGGFQIIENLDLSAIGDPISTAAVGSSGDFVLFSTGGAAAGGSSQDFHQFVWGAGSYSRAGGGALQPGAAVPLKANLFAFTGNPFEGDHERALGSRQVLDWTMSGGFSTVSALGYASPTSGLSDPQSISTGPAPIGTGFELVNQYHPAISLYSFETTLGDTARKVEVSPPPGVYQGAIKVRLALAGGGGEIFYRTSPSAAFQPYLGPFWLIEDSTVSFYATFPSGQSPIASARYLFDDEAGSLDSDADGVPDFVEIARGLDPDGSLGEAGEPSDYDGDGFSDLEELLGGTDPADPTDHPAEHRAGYDTLVLDISVDGFDGFANASATAAAGTPVNVYDTEGRLLGSGSTGNPAPNRLNLSVHPLDASMRMLIVATRFHFDLITPNADKSIGRELVAAVEIPPTPQVDIEFDFASSNPATRVEDWIALADAAYGSRPPVAVSLDWRQTVQLILLERILGNALGSGSIPQVSLTPFRPNENAGGQFVSITAAELLDIEQPSDPALAEVVRSSTLDSLFDFVNSIAGSPGPGFSELFDISRDIYEISSELNNGAPGKYAMPLDAIRSLTSPGGAPPTAYDLLLNRPFDDYVAVSDAILGLASDLPQRPYLMVDLKVLSAPGVPLATSLDGTTTYALYDRYGDPFEFPETFVLAAGSCLRVGAYTDLPSPAGADQSLAVLTVELLTIPVASAGDTDGNLLPDSWELFFFGSTGLDRNSSPDGSGITLLQQFLDGTDPTDPSDSAAQAVVLELANVEIGPQVGGELVFKWHWPEGYAKHFEFGVVDSSDLEEFAETPSAVIDLGGGAFCATVPGDPQARSRFMKVFLRLR